MTPLRLRPRTLHGIVAVVGSFFLVLETCAEGSSRRWDIVLFSNGTIGFLPAGQFSINWILRLGEVDL